MGPTDTVAVLPPKGLVFGEAAGVAVGSVVAPIDPEPGRHSDRNGQIETQQGQLPARPYCTAKTSSQESKFTAVGKIISPESTLTD